MEEQYRQFQRKETKQRNGKLGKYLISAFSSGASDHQTSVNYNGALVFDGVSFKLADLEIFQ